jgi:hypothetical protein
VDDAASRRWNDREWPDLDSGIRSKLKASAATLPRRTVLRRRRRWQ